MKFFARCIDSIERRPFIFGSLFLFFLVFSCVEQFLYSLYKALLSDGVSKMFSFLSANGSGNAADLGSAMNATEVQASNAAGGIFTAVLIGLLVLFAVTAVVSVYLSGYMHILNISLKPNKEKTKGEFKKGVIKHYFKFTFYIFSHIIIFLITAAGAAVAMFPAIISFNMAYSGKNELLLPSLFLFLLTLIVVVFIVSIIIMYSFYMYPALVNFKKGSFYMARKVVKAKFWYILPRVAGFVVLIMGWQYFMIKIGYGTNTNEFAGAVAGFVLNAMFKTYVVFLLGFFVFFTFRQIKNAIQAEENQDELDGINDIGVSSQINSQES